MHQVAHYARRDILWQLFTLKVIIGLTHVRIPSLYSAEATMHTRHTKKITDDMNNTDTHLDHQLKIIHHHYVPPFDLITCEMLDSVLQKATAEQIAKFSQFHVDTVRRILHTIESTLCTSSHSQIIVNCQFRQWSTSNQQPKTSEIHTLE